MLNHTILKIMDNDSKLHNLSHTRTTLTPLRTEISFPVFTAISTPNSLQTSSNPPTVTEQNMIQGSPSQDQIEIRSNQNPFPGILKRMLCPESAMKYRTADGKNPLIGWSDDGKLLFIRNPQTLFCSMMADFFVTTNLSSFIRQLNHYNFTKVKIRDHSLSSRLKQDQMLVYEHPTFNRDVQGDLQRKPKGFTRVPKRMANDDHVDVVEAKRVNTSDFVTWDKHNEIAGDRKAIWDVLQRHDKLVNDMQLQIQEMKTSHEQEVGALKTKVFELERVVGKQQKQLEKLSLIEIVAPPKLRKTRSETGC